MGCQLLHTLFYSKLDQDSRCQSLIHQVQHQVILCQIVLLARNKGFGSQ